MGSRSASAAFAAAALLAAIGGIAYWRTVGTPDAPPVSRSAFGPTAAAPTPEAPRATPRPRAQLLAEQKKSFPPAFYGEEDPTTPSATERERELLSAGHPDKPVKPGARATAPLRQAPDEPSVSPTDQLEPVRRAFEAGEDALEACYAEAYEELTGLAGTAFVQFRLDDEGRARPLRVRTSEGLPDGDLGPCLADIVGGLDFADIPAGTRVSWPLHFNEDGAFELGN